jgi:hypothetical protein
MAALDWSTMGLARVIGFEYLSSYIQLSRFSQEDWDTVTVVPQRIQRKLNYFSFCQIFANF